MSVHHLAVGDPSHGVTRLALQLTEGRPRTLVPTVRDLADARAARDRLPPADTAPALHLHLTDALLGDDPIGALRTIGAGRRLAVTLHDVPQPAEGRRRWRRRAALYAGLAAAADLVLVSSVHEHAAVRALGAGVDGVLPLPIDALRVPPRPDDAPTVGVLGWVHPGKGLAVLAVAVAATRRPATLVALGAVAPGHEELPAMLARGCDVLGLGFRCTGYLDDAELLHEAARVRVPVCPHRHVSASGSIGSWLSAGRRPVVADGGYAREVDARMPGALDVTADLASSIAAALDDPARTVLPAGVPTGPTTTDAALAQDEALRRWAAGATLAA